MRSSAAKLLKIWLDNRMSWLWRRISNKWFICLFKMEQNSELIHVYNSTQFVAETFDFKWLSVETMHCHLCVCECVRNRNDRQIWGKSPIQLTTVGNAIRCIVSIVQQCQFLYVLKFRLKLLRSESMSGVYNAWLGIKQGIIRNI